jgi:hypothetical protein
MIPLIQEEFEKRFVQYMCCRLDMNKVTNLSPILGILEILSQPPQLIIFTNL